MTQVPTAAEEHPVQEAAKEGKNQICPCGGTKPDLQGRRDQREQNYPCHQSTVSPKSIQIRCHALSHPFGWCS